MRLKLHIGIAMVAALVLTQTTAGHSNTTIRPIAQEQFKTVVVPSFIKDFKSTKPVHLVPKAPKKPVVVPKPKIEVKNVSHTPTVADAKAYARSKLGKTQYACLYKLFKAESGWRTTARNRSSGAYGIPQALPGSKMAKIAPDWKTNPVTQVKWGIKYVNGKKYGSACIAWNFFKRNGWY